MSVIVINICRPLQMTPAQKSVLMALADRADDHGLCWPSIPWICAWTCFGRTAVIDALKRLEIEGIVQISKTPGRNNLCAIDLDLARRLGPADQFSRRRGIDLVGALEATNEATPSEGTSSSDQYAGRTRPAGGPVREADHHQSVRRTTTSPPGGLTRPPGGPNTSLDINKTSDRHSARTQKSIDSLPEGFAELWDAYPLKTGKLQAIKAFRALNPSADVLALILAGLAKWKRHERWTKEGGKYRHHASTWITQRLWEDEEVCGKVHISPEATVWWRVAGFDHIAEAQNARCHIGNYREFRDGKRIPAEEVA